MLALTAFVGLFWLILAEGNDDVERAVQICRDKLREEPDFPKVKFSLAKLLESKEGHDLEEIGALYEQAGGESARKLASAERIHSLLKCGGIYESMGNIKRSYQCFYDAIGILYDASDVSKVLEQASHVLLSVQAEDISALLSKLRARFPEEPSVLQIQGAVMRKQGKSQEAYVAYDVASTLPHETDDLLAQSLVLAASAAREAGMDTVVQMSYLERAARLDLDNRSRADLFNNMGIVHKKSGKKQEALRYFRLALETKPYDGHAMVHLASMNVDTTGVTTLDHDYVAGLFDGYSTRFEDELVETLGYKGHEMVVDGLRYFYESTEATEPKIVVDLGCGTGLTGNVVANAFPKVEILGVDLSERMAQTSRSKRRKNDAPVYSVVHHMDAMRFLRSLQPGSIDAIVASDVFIYIGDLDSVFGESRNRLVEGGALVFTIEEATTGMKLLPSGRFGHSREYIEKLATLHNYEMLQWKADTLRLQNGMGVPGGTVVLRAGP